MESLEKGVRFKNILVNFVFFLTFFLKAKNKYVIVKKFFFSLFMIFLYFLGNLRGVISITFFPPRPRFSPIGQRKVQKSDFRCLPGAVNRGINIFFPFFQVFTDFVDEYKVRSAMKLFFSRNSCLIYSAISNE